MYLFYCPLFSIVCVCVYVHMSLFVRGKYEENRGESRVQTFIAERLNMEVTSRWNGDSVMLIYIHAG